MAGGRTLALWLLAGNTICTASDLAIWVGAGGMFIACVFALNAWAALVLLDVLTRNPDPTGL